ncbi:MAG: hypothetical protein ACTH31_13015, partial [Pseudoclavibacter sp.]
MSRMDRVVGAAALAATLVVSLAACTQTAESGIAADDCVPVIASGGPTDSIATTGGFGSAADATFAAPLSVASPSVTVGGSGTGAPVTEHGIVSASLRLFDASTGEAIDDYLPLRADESGATAPVPVEAVAAGMPGLADALQCARAGDRVVAAMPATDLFGEESALLLPMTAETIVAVTDVLHVFPSSASGVVLPPENGIPAVVASPSGQPGVTMPAQAAPDQQQSALRIRGFGDDIAAGDRLTVHVAAFSWTTGAQLGPGWGDAGSVLKVAATDGPSDDGLSGATSALIGQPNGSQVIVVIPESQATQYPGIL